MACASPSLRHIQRAQYNYRCIDLVKMIKINPRNESLIILDYMGKIPGKMLFQLSLRHSYS